MEPLFPCSHALWQTGKARRPLAFRLGSHRVTVSDLPLCICSLCHRSFYALDLLVCIEETLAACAQQGRLDASYSYPDLIAMPKKGASV